jgi:ribonuclease BN (tRNA processing enzyme)
VLVRALLRASDRLLGEQFPLTLHELGSGEALPLADGVTLRVCKTPHNGESLAVRLEAGGRALGYTGDTAPSDELARFFVGVDLLLAECSFDCRRRCLRPLIADVNREADAAAD